MVSLPLFQRALSWTMAAKHSRNAKMMVGCLHSAVSLIIQQSARIRPLFFNAVHSILHHSFAMNPVQSLLQEVSFKIHQ